MDFPKFLGIAMETFLTMCDDTESDVRMVADECLNRSIKVKKGMNRGSQIQSWEISTSCLEISLFFCFIM